MSETEETEEIFLQDPVLTLEILRYNVIHLRKELGYSQADFVFALRQAGLEIKQHEYKFFEQRYMANIVEAASKILNVSPCDLLIPPKEDDENIQNLKKRKNLKKEIEAAVSVEEKSDIVGSTNGYDTYARFPVLDEHRAAAAKSLREYGERNNWQEEDIQEALDTLFHNLKS